MVTYKVLVLYNTYTHSLPERKVNSSPETTANLDDLNEDLGLICPKCKHIYA